MGKWSDFWELKLRRWRLNREFRAHRRMVKRDNRLKPAPFDHLTDADYLDAEITLSRTVCFGSCPAYTVYVRGDGWVEYNGEVFVEVEGHQTAQVDPAEVRRLIQAFYRINFFALHNEYKTFWTDGPMLGVSILIAGQFKGIVDAGDGPMRLFELSKAIDQVAGTKRWIGE